MEARDDVPCAPQAPRNHEGEGEDVTGAEEEGGNAEGNAEGNAGGTEGEAPPSKRKVLGKNAMQSSLTPTPLVTNCR